ncbi:gliding-motility protein MglA [candidate division KSB1 bacterium]|nr:gliding-motility protein MglA [candidate division KSB1 bacterium]MBL7092622.1 gliding-motility protein MglA [candidate division KSB1 bacterium]
MVIKELLGEIHLKIVYFGPGLSGKTTNLEKMHSKLGPTCSSELTTIKTREDRTLFFDFMQIKTGKINGLTPNFNIYTVPGQTYYKETRRLVLAGVDGIVFVADSQADRMDYNVESFYDLKSFLKELGKSFDEIPVILQCNKQDTDSALKPEVIKEKLSANGLKFFPASAIQGKGVFETLTEIIVQVGKNLEK